MSISVLGLASRMLSIAISDWPPAMMRASLPSSAEHVERFVEMFGAHIIECGGLHRCPPNKPRSFASNDGRDRPGCAAGLTRQRREELADDHARGAIEQAAADARDLAADRRLVDVADRGAAIRRLGPA